MAVFEVKNYADPESDDFDQVVSQLGQPHYGSLAFLVTRAPEIALKESTLRQFRDSYQKHRDGKLVIILPSALLVELLVDVQFGRTRLANRKITDWLEEFLLKHLNEPRKTKKIEY